MVSEDCKRGFRPSEVVSPVSEGFHDSQQLSFVDIVVSFGRCEGCRIKGNRV